MNCAATGRLPCISQELAIENVHLLGSNEAVSGFSFYAGPLSKLHSQILMRLSIFSVCFLLFSVHATPLIARPPTVAPKAPSLPPAEPAEPAQAPVNKAPPKVPAPPAEPPAAPAPPAPAKPPPKTPPKVPTEPVEPPKGPAKPPVKPKPKPHCTKKRADNPVDEAAHGRTTQLGYGNTAFVYKTTFEGKDAVIKVIDASRPGGSEESVKKEVTNLKTVDQLFGWGEKKTDKGHFFYLVMHNMGTSAAKTGLTEAELGKIVGEAKKRYQDQYHMDNRDQNPNNFVYRQVNGKWQAEIVDWARASYSGTKPQPAPGTPEAVQDPAKCVVM
ncbi:hypothetical protein DXG01_008263 [Tephrocybe rancida]|nr:hypothetical protein DXG01_008263 [Tephrocybe rancida]